MGEKILLAFTVLCFIEHNGKGYNAGDPIELTAEEAMPLEAVRAVAPTGGKAADQAVDLTTAELRGQLDARHADLDEAGTHINNLVQENETLRNDVQTLQVAATAEAERLATVQIALDQANADKAGLTAQLATVQAALAAASASAPAPAPKAKK